MRLRVPCFATDSGRAGQFKNTDLETNLIMPAPKGNDYAEGNSGGEPAPKWNTRAMTHGATCAPSQARRTFSESEHELADILVAGWLEHAPFDADSALTQRLEATAVRSVLEARGLAAVSEEIAVDRIRGVTEDGEAITELDEHYLARFTSQLSKDIRMTLKDLGCLPDPDSQQADAQRSIADVFATAVDRQDSGEG